MCRDINAWLRYRHRNLTAPYDVLTKTAAESLVPREPDLICGFKKNFDEPLTLPFRDRPIRVMT